MAELACWKSAEVRDKAQLPVRARALEQGKLVYMAVPKLATPEPFYLVDPATLHVSPREAASSRIAATMAPITEVDALRPVDVVVLGSVAVNRDGARIGKGARCSDLEFALLTEAGLVGPHTLVVTTVHSLQMIDVPIPVTDHVVNVDLVVTPEAVIECTLPRRPKGIFWDHLDDSNLAAIPALQSRVSLIDRGRNR